jgi:hypothetical protein
MSSSTPSKLSKPAPVTPPATTKKSKSRQQIVDIDETIPRQRKRKESQSTEIPNIDSTKIIEPTKEPPKTNTELFPIVSPKSDIAVISSDSDEDSKIPATTVTEVSPPIDPSPTPNDGTQLTTDPTTATIPPASLPAKKKKLMATFSIGTNAASKTRSKKIPAGTPIIRAIVVGDSSTKTTVVFRTEKEDKASCWCDRRLELENDIEDGWCRKLNMELNWAKKHGTDYKTLEYHINGEKVRVQGNYPTRLFTVIINSSKNMHSIIEKAQIICDTLTTKFPGDNRLIGLDPDNLIWSTEPITWSELIGVAPAYQLLLHKTQIVPPAAPTQGFFEQHKDIIFDYFENGTFNKQIQELLFAPDSVLHEDLLPTTPITTEVQPAPAETT